MRLPVRLPAPGPNKSAPLSRSELLKTRRKLLSEKSSSTFKMNSSRSGVSVRSRKLSAVPTTILLKVSVLNVALNRKPAFAGLSKLNKSLLLSLGSESTRLVSMLNVPVTGCPPNPPGRVVVPNVLPV